ncbi:integrase arm-type DNA-binding domain-containing protein [Geomonas nitrogeniifigens]|uniref:tyrosine-type recombinase/integrase n=1 Tax=Geomonas diazotrophica TaxID=2843197 RepID=UPI001C2CB02F|nr:integrase arm-type DNA-binding domain-containing protein [Geomonas nitrogeniifigens]QXE86615.1 integrase arm-type DNA-binding domain-containing protein [Geomonas nitrogeniifigens]
MKVTTFTDAMIKKLRPENKKYVRGEGNGFTIRVMPSGVKTWLYIYSFGDKRREMNLGGYPDVTLETARDKFMAAKRKVKNGLDPIAEKKAAVEALRNELTFHQLATEYIANNVEGQLTEKSVYDIKRVLLGSEKDGAVDDFKSWRSKKASSITAEDVAKLLKAVSERSAAAARNIIKTARPMFAYALPRGIVGENPFILASIKSFLSKPVRSKLEPTFKNRTLTEDEIRHVWNSLQTGKGSIEAKNALRLMLLTGQRPSEVLGLHSDEINGNWWTLPKHRTKARLDVKRADHMVYLVPESLQIIGMKSGLIFKSPAPAKIKPGEPAVIKPIAINALGHMLRANNYFGLPPWGAHDLRRTCRTFMSDIDGITTNAAEAILNHAKEGTKRNYDQHKYQRQIENALTLWRDKLVEIIGKPLVQDLPSNVIPIRGKSATN